MPTPSRPAPRKLPVPWPILVLGVLAVLAVGYSLFAPRASAAEHPAPRAGITAAHVQPAERYAEDPRVAQVYAEVAKMAETVDGLYCYCHCSRHAGHRSLLSCFEEDHGAQCDVCLGEADLAYRMKQQGASLEQIRREIDRQFGHRA
ncbi:MAG: hypothetical protein JO040_09865 [Gemmatimonadetes bacterium]|nr:hypothetical protein [Gemmatimonadota bacterium]